MGNIVNSQGQSSFGVDSAAFTTPFGWASTTAARKPVLFLPEAPMIGDVEQWRPAMPGERPEAIVALTRDAAARLDAEVRLWNDLLLPTADLSNSGLCRADRGASEVDEGTIRIVLRGLSTIHDRVARLPMRVRHSEDLEVLLMARLVTRACDLEPSHNPSQPTLIDYPAAGLIPFPDRQAEKLAAAGFLSRRFFDRLHVCPGCQSSRLNVREECTHCRSTALQTESVVHHFRCAHQAREASFRQDDRLICPKCRKELHHFGVDYDRPGTITACARCGHAEGEPSVGFLCLDCGGRHDTERVATRDWYAYSVTAAGKQALESGQITNAGRPARNIPCQVMRALVLNALRVERRYGRPFAVVTLRFGAENGDAGTGHSEGHLVCGLVLDLVRENFGDTDFITETARGCVLYLPETTQSNAIEAMQRLARTVKDTINHDLALQWEVFGGPDAEAVVDRLS